MSNKRITDLTELTTPTTDDVFPIVDIATNTTQKVQVGNLPIQTAVTTALATKQATLVSGTNIKTVNSTTLLGSGDIAVQTPLVSGTSIKTVNSNSLLGAGDVAVQPTLVSGTNIKTLNSVSLLGSGDIVLAATPSGVSGAIQFSNGSAFASDASNFFWDNTNKRLGVGTNAPSATAHFKGSGSTSATTSLLVQNSAGFNALKVVDDRSVGMYAFSQLCMNSNADTNTNGSLRFLVLSSSGNSYIDGWSDGTGKAQNYPLVIGSRVGNLGSSLTGNTTTENGTPVIFGFEAAQASALVTINSTTRGFLPPRGTNTQMNAIASPATGLVFYDTTTNKLCCYNGSTWNDLF